MGQVPSPPRPSRSRASFTIRQKLTKAAPIPGTGPQGDSRGAGQQLSGTDGLGGGEDWSHQLPGPLTPRFIPFPKKQKRIQQHRPQRGGRAIAARQRTQLLWAPHGFSCSRRWLSRRQRRRRLRPRLSGPEPPSDSAPGAANSSAPHSAVPASSVPP